jgi:hypothetical protein
LEFKKLGFEKGRLSILYLMKYYYFFWLRAVLLSKASRVCSVTELYQGYSVSNHTWCVCAINQLPKVAYKLLLHSLAFLVAQRYLNAF